MLIQYTIKTSTPGSLDFLSPAEVERLPAERFAKRRAEWLLGRWSAKALLRAVDPQAAALPLSAISVENEPGGAPFYRVAGVDHPACLSVSHSHEAAFCALSFDLTIGADLEWVEPRSRAFMEDYLTSAEARSARALQGAEQSAWVTLVWSAKEAALKALRIGLRADTRAVELVRASTPPAGGWGALELRSDLPGTERLRGWWREEHGFVLTLAALTDTKECTIEKI